MEDLLKEDDFITPIKYNPWRHFVLFYIITAVISVALSFLFIEPVIQEPVETIFTVGYLFLPLIMGIIMFFSKKENLMITIKTSVLSQLLLMTLCYVTFLFSSVFIAQTDYSINDNVFMLLIILALYSINFIIASTIIAIILKVKRKKQNLKV